jgi:hypothetical protein
MYVFTNLAYTGAFRVLMVNVYWKPWQVVIFKVIVIFTSLLYVAFGFIYLIGSDSLTNSVDQFNQSIDELIYASYLDSTFSPDIFFYQKLENTVNNAYLKISNFMILYVFNNFGLSIAIVGKISDFDGTIDF